MTCFFCRIVRKEIPAKVVFENETVLAFSDINPQAPVHILVVPKKHVARLMDLGPDDLSLLGPVHQSLQDIARKTGVEKTGFRVVVNNGADAGQAVDHIHYHLLGGRLLGWPPG